ncbi:hypothetical protein HPB49_016189 [Dermacentor silvarum]|uniref:Uncharacterized protein n=1 Tax=Dermacentor silvarum TaxID=543639 RepID=A0ACB8D6K2_DERSI|nr:hypothetical protein HPB49_016189 [Dermacentor silvarum]
MLYRLFTTVVKSWLRAWAECSRAVTELQNGFRSNRRLEDNLFTLSQTTDLSRKESQGLVACFLDVAKVQDSIPHEPMLSRMSALNMTPPLVDRLLRLYENNPVVACLGGAQSLPVPVRRGLKQGCPLSPLLYTCYMFRVSQRGTTRHLGAAWTLVLLAETVIDLQRLVTLSSTHLARLGLSFIPKKSAVIQFSGRPEVNMVLLPDNDTIPGTQTACATRVRTLSRKFSFLAQLLQASGTQNRSHAARQRVHEVETEQWRSFMLNKSTLELYRTSPLQLWRTSATTTRGVHCSLKHTQEHSLDPPILAALRYIPNSAKCHLPGMWGGSRMRDACRPVYWGVVNSPRGTTLPQALGFETNNVAPSPVVATTKETSTALVADPAARPWRL